MSTTTDLTGSGHTTPTSTFVRPVGVMPRPGQAGAPYFDNTNVTEFLRRWNLECEDFGLTDRQKCARLPDYCTPKTKDVVELLEGYKTSNWTKLQEELKGLFWQYDRQRDTPAALNELIRDAPNLDLNVYVLKYDSITDALVKGKEMSTTQRVRRFLDGLSSHMRDKAFEYCTQEHWKLSSHDTGTTDPDFAKLKEFILDRAETAKRKIVYNKERALEDGYDGLGESVIAAIGRPNTPVSSPSAPTPSALPPTTPMDPAIAELTKQFSQLALLLKANIESSRPEATPPTQRPSAPYRQFDRTPRCMWCDSTEHARRQCAEFPEAIRQGRIRLNELNRVVNAATGLEVPLMFGKGGMKKFLESTVSSSVITASTTNITIDDLCGQIGEGSVMITTLDFENDTRTDEIMDVDVWEKRKREASKKERRVKPRTEGSIPEFNPSEANPMNRTWPIPSPPLQAARPSPSPGPSRTAQPSPSPSPSQTAQPPFFPRAQSLPPRTTPSAEPFVPDLDDDSDEEMIDESTKPVAGNKKRKYRLASKINETVTIADVGEKIMDTPIQLNLRELCAVSPEISGYMHDQTRKHRMPIEPITAATTATVNPTNVVKPLYACASARAKVVLNGEIKVNALLDNGSEVNIMSGRLFKQLDNPPIDTDVKWRINAFNTADGAEASGVMGLCHKMSVDIGGVEVDVPIFVVEDSVQDLLLGRPWERAVRASFINEDDGSYTVHIKSPDGRRIVKFCAVTSMHERNKEFARHTTMVPALKA
jgi:hypothetical protein